MGLLKVGHLLGVCNEYSFKHIFDKQNKRISEIIQSSFDNIRRSEAESANDIIRKTFYSFLVKIEQKIFFRDFLL